MVAKSINNPLYKLNIAVLLQQQRFLLPVSFLFYTYNGLSLPDFVLFQSVFYFVCLFAEVPTGYISDILPRKYILIFSYFLFILRIILWLTIPCYWTILLGEILYGLSKSFYRGCSDGYIYDYLNYHKIPESMLKKYGNYNFFMSLGCAISGLLGAYFYKIFAFKVILSFELIIHIVAILFLIFLPKIPHSKVNNNGFKSHIITLFETVKQTIKNKNISYYIYCTGVLTGITSLFVWNFQPLMKEAGVPIFIFGVVYFLNHILRSFGSLFSQKIINIISLNKLSFVCFSLYLMGLGIYIYNYKILEPKICTVSLFIICIFIGVQMVFNVASVAEIHKFLSSKTRATGSSVNNMFSSFCSGTFLMIFKELISFQSKTRVFAMFFVFLVCALSSAIKYCRDN